MANLYLLWVIYFFFLDCMTESVLCGYNLKAGRLVPYISRKVLSMVSSERVTHLSGLISRCIIP